MDKKFSDNSEKAKNDESKLISFCSLCESRLPNSKMQVISKKADTKLVHVTCGQCQVAILYLIFPSAVGRSTIGLVTDLLFDEVKKYRSTVSISTDDVIEIHSFLEDNEAVNRFLLDRSDDLTQNAQSSA